MLKKNYFVLCGLFMCITILIFISIMYKIHSYMAIGSSVLTTSHPVPIDEHGIIRYITEAQYGNLKMMCFVFIINLIIMGIFFCKAKIPYGRIGLDK